MRKVMKIARWVLTGLFLILVFAGGASAAFFALAAALTVPINKVIEMKRKIKIKPVVTVLIVLVLFFVGSSLLPSTEPIEGEQLDSPTISNDLVTDAESQDEIEISATEQTTNSEADNSNSSQPEHEETFLPQEDTTENSANTSSPIQGDLNNPTTPDIPPNSTFSIHYIDVGQADAALVECDGHYMLIDGGNKGDSNVIYSVLKKAEVPKLDIVVGTHGHEDHIGGLPGAFNFTSADITLCPVTTYDSDAFKDFAKYANQNGGGITVPSVGDTYTLGSAHITILGVNGASDANNTSIVLMVQYGETSFLFTGDAEREAEQAILNSGVDLSATILKVGHHGSDTSTTYPFLREVMPQYAVISVGDGNSYDHPTDSTLSRLRDADVTIYRTDIHGDVYVSSDGKTITISSDYTATTDEIMTPGGTTVRPQKPTTTDEEVNSEVPSVSAGTDYVLNTNSRKFHYPSCGSAKKIKDSNRQEYTGTRDELIDMGYNPCGNCDP